MKADFTPEILPLGWQLQLAGRRLEQGARLPFAWLQAGDAVRQRAAALAALGAPRFARVEAGAAGPGDGAAAPAPGNGAAAPAPWESAFPLPAPESAFDTRAPGRGLPPAVRERLADHVGAAAHALRVHEGEAADALARAHGADALSIGADVYFAQGQYRPHDPHGFALLAHEALHIAHALAPNVDWQRGSAAALAAEEARADALERQLLRPAASAAQPWPSRPAAAAPAWVAPPRTDRRAPMSAGQDAAMSGAAGHGAAPGGLGATGSMPALAGAAARQAMAAASARAEAPPAPSAAPLDLDALRQSLLRELKQQIRADMERGG